MKCIHCKKDIKDSIVLKAAGAIVARRRRRAGNQITPERAREIQLKSAAARSTNAAAKKEVEL
jgi:hypothetical protein